MILHKHLLIGSSDLMSIQEAIQPLKYYFGKFEYKSISIKSDFEILEQELQNLIHLNSIVVVWQIHNVIWGRYQNNKLELLDGTRSANFYQEIRVFNEVEELHLIKIDDEFLGRYIKDGTGQEVRYVDSFSRFWGEKYIIKDGFIELRDIGRKISLKIPFDEKFSDAKYLGLTTRNYIGSDENTGLSGYIDYRFLSISSAEH